MERDINIKTKDKHLIYGTLRGSLKKPLIVFVHGLTGMKDEHMFYNGARYFEEEGFSTYRFNLYHWDKGGRTFTDAPLSTQASDLDRVIQYFRKKGAKQVFVVGHSFGGPVITASVDQDYDGVVLWDGTTKDFFTKGLKYVKSLKAYFGKGMIMFGVGKQFVKEVKGQEYTSKLLETGKPHLVIAAGKGILIKYWKKYFSKKVKGGTMVVIPKADHYFAEDGVANKLFGLTTTWLKKQLKS